VRFALCALRYALSRASSPDSFEQRRRFCPSNDCKLQGFPLAYLLRFSLTQLNLHQLTIENPKEQLMTLYDAT
jgi:hypothetical protein